MCIQQVRECFTECPDIQGETRVIFITLFFWEVVTVHWPLVCQSKARVDLEVSHSQGEPALTEAVRAAQCRRS